MLSAVTDVGIDANEQALSTWWNRWLDTYDAAMAIGHRVLRSPEGDPRTLGLLDELDQEFPNNGHPLLRFSRVHYKVGYTRSWSGIRIWAFKRPTWTPIPGPQK